MIVPVEFFAATCDQCNSDWYGESTGWSAMNDQSLLIEEMQNEGWYVCDSKGDELSHTYCQDCYVLGEEGELIVLKNKE